MRRALRFWPLALVATLTGCPRREVPAAGGAAPPADASLADAPNDGSRARADSGDAATTVEVRGALPWTESIRRHEWTAAETAIAALPEGEQSKPEVRYARARVALALGKHAEAVTRLEKLEDALPLLRETIGKTRAEAALIAGPFAIAAEWYGARPEPSAWLTAAEAWEKAGQPARARTLCDRALAVAKTTRARQERARTLRMRVVRAKDGDSAAVADARWLAINALDATTVSAASELLAKEQRPVRLTADELLARAGVLAGIGRSEDALKVVERAASAGRAGGGKPASPLDLCHARAEAFYKARTRYPEAALAYRSCAALGGPRAAEDLFLSARAFSRADRDGDALPAFASVRQRHPRTTWADQAEFHVARSHVLAGRWKEGAHALDEYIVHFPKGHHQKEAERYRAIAHLNAQNDKTARKLLEELAGSSTDSTARARWQNLAALAAFRDGDRTLAIGRWSAVARSHPLSWPALVARARLAAASAPLPPTIEPAETFGESERLVIELPPPVDVLHRIGLDGDAQEALRGREDAVIAKAQGRGTEALCAAYALLDRGKRRYQISRRVPSALLGTAPGPRNRWAWDCVYPRPHKDSVHEHEASAKLPPDLLWAVMRQESAFDEAVVSPARAVGLLQLMPKTARLVASGAGLAHEESWLVRPDHNVQLGALYMRDLLGKLDGNVALASGAYNAGPEAITRWRSRAKGVSLDIFVETIPFLETRGYVVRVMGNLARYGYMEHGEAGVPAVKLDLK